MLWQFLKILNIELPYDPAIPLPDIYTEELNTGTRTGNYTPIIVAALFTMGKMWKQPKCSSTNEWINNMWYIHQCIHNSPLKSKKLHATTWMTLEDIMLSEINQPQKGKYS